MILRIAVALSLLAAAPALADLRAGAHAIDVTPTKFPISLNGGFSDNMAKAANDPIHARCLVLDDGQTTLALVVVDSCMVPTEVQAAAKALASKATGMPTTHMMISATHTHSAPTLSPVFQSAPDEGYVKFLTRKIADGISKAHELRRPAEVGFGRATLPEQVFNRRWKREQNLIPKDPFGNTTDLVQMNPGHQVPGLDKSAGPVDPEICFLSVRTREGKPLAILANYSLHYVGGNPGVSADYFGAFADRIKQLVAPDEKGFVGIMSNGTSGDVNNIDFGSPAMKHGPGEKIKVVADAVARKVAAALTDVKHGHDLTVAAATKELRLGVRKPTAADVERAKGILAAKKGPTLVGSAEVYAGETVAMAAYPDAVDLTVQVLRIGDVQANAIPCEVFTEIGLELKKSSEFANRFTVSLANGYNGYLPTPEQHKLGGYETWRARSSYLEVDASTKIIRAIQELWKQMKP